MQPGLLTKKQASIIMIIILILGAGGYFAYRQFRDTDTAMVILGGEAHNGSLTLPKVGLSLSLPAELGDLSYKVEPDAPEGKPAVSFTSKELIAKGGSGCQIHGDDNAAPYPLGMLIESSEHPDKVEKELKDGRNEDAAALGTFVTQRGGAYYYFVKPTVACSQAPGVFDLQRTRIEMLIKSIQAAK